MGNNRLGLIFEIAADPSKAVKAVDYFSAQQKAAAEAVVRSNHIISESYAKVGKQTMTAAAEQKAWMDSLQQATLRNIAATKAVGEADHRSTVQAEADYLAKAKAIEGVTAATVETGVINREVAGETRAQFLAMQEGQQGMMQGFYDGIRGLRMFRTAFAATIGLASFGFWIVEWKNVATYIANAVQALGGFDAYMKQVQQDAIWLSTAAFQAGGGAMQAQILAAAKAAKTMTDFEKERLQIEQQYAQTSQTRITQELNVELPAYYERQKQLDALNKQRERLLQNQGSFGGGAAAAKGLSAIQAQIDVLQKLQNASSFAGKSMKDLAAEQKQLSKALTESSKHVLELQTQAQTERLSQTAKETKGAKAAASAASKKARELQHTQEVAARWYASSLRAIAQEKREQDAWNKSMEKSIEHAIKLGETVETSAAKHSAALHKSSLATLPQGPKNEVPGSAGGDMFFQAAQASVKPLTAQRQALLALNDAFAGTHTSMQNFTGEAAVASAASDKFARGMGHAITQAVVYGQSVGKAVETALKATLASIAEEAAARSLFSLATYWIDMATYQYTSAAQALTAAEIFGAVAGGAGAAASAIPGGGGGGSRGGRGSASRNAGSRSGGSGGSGGSRGGSNSGQQVVPSGNFPSGPKSGNLTIAVMGESEAGAWLANTINKAVQQGGAELTATHTTAIPQPTA